MEQAHEGLEWLDFLPYTQIPDASSGGTDAEDAATDAGSAQEETPAENGDTPQENVTDTTDTPAGKYDGCSGILTGKYIRRSAGRCSAASRGRMLRIPRRRQDPRHLKRIHLNIDR